MQTVLGKTQTVQDLLSNSKYGIDYYQREYQWKTKQIAELIDDLTNRFLDDYQDDHDFQKIAKYGHYFLGSIIISQKDSDKFIVDGQQRLTSLTLLLVFLNNLQKKNLQENSSFHMVNIEPMIFSNKYGKKSFNLDVLERNDCMDALFKNVSFDTTEKSESIVNLVYRYNDIEDLFPEELKDKALPYFIYWLQDKVLLVEITAASDDDAYLIFETMNDRGLSLSPTEMLKGYLLANITDLEKREQANNLIKKWLLEFKNISKDTESDFFKTWLRSQYAQDVRDRKKDAKPKDFDLIGTEYHRWIRNNANQIGLNSSTDFSKWVNIDLDFYARIYKELLNASINLVPGWEPIRYNADHGFTLQFQLLMAPLKPSDDQVITQNKVALVAHFLDSWINRRLWHFKSNSYSNMSYSVFQLIKSIRGLDLEELRAYLIARLEEESKELDFTNQLYLHQQNSKSLHRQLARITAWLEVKSGQVNHYTDYVVRSGKHAYEIEHIWSNHFEEHSNDFSNEYDFKSYRNRLGGLLLLPKEVNASLGDDPYSEKVEVYLTQNLLARSLHPQAYQNNPGFRKMREKTGLKFAPIHKDNQESVFTKADFDSRFELYQGIAKQIWSVDVLKECYFG